MCGGHAKHVNRGSLVQVYSLCVRKVSMLIKCRMSVNEMCMLNVNECKDDSVVNVYVEIYIYIYIYINILMG